MEISVDDLLKINNPNIIDIRSNQRYNDNHIPGAINIDNNSLLNNPSKYLNKNIKYYIYCQKGITSYNTCQILNAMGYNIINVLGGYESYLLKKI